MCAKFYHFASLIIKLYNKNQGFP